MGAGKSRPAGGFMDPVVQEDEARLNVLRETGGRLARAGVFTVSMTFHDGYLKNIVIKDYSLFRAPRPMPAGSFHPENRIDAEPATYFGKSAAMRFARIARLVEERRFAALDTTDAEIAMLLALYLATSRIAPGGLPGSVDRVFGYWSRFAARIEAIQNIV